MSCSCGTQSVVIIGGNGILVTGSAAPNDPLKIELEESLVHLQASDSSTIDMQIVGSGSTADPFILFADAKLSMSDLIDVDPNGAPTLGDTVVWDGTRFVFDAPPSTPPGAVNVSSGIEGDGSIGDPLQAAVSETVEDSTDGLGIYVDTAGKLRAVLPPAVSLVWTAITGKPTTFPAAWTGVTGKPDVFPPAAHTHTPADITGAINAATVGGRKFFVQSSTPGTFANGDIWIQTT